MDKKAEGGNTQSNEMGGMVCKACALEGCNKSMHCFGGSAKGLCVEAIARYNGLRKKELEEEMDVEEDHEQEEAEGEELQPTIREGQAEIEEARRAGLEVAEDIGICLLLEGARENKR